MKKMFLFLAAASLVSATAFAQDDYDYGEDDYGSSESASASDDGYTDMGSEEKASEEQSSSDVDYKSMDDESKKTSRNEGEGGSVFDKPYNLGWNFGAGLSGLFSTEVCIPNVPGSCGDYGGDLFGGAVEFGGSLNYHFNNFLSLIAMANLEVKMYSADIGAFPVTYYDDYGYSHSEWSELTIDVYSLALKVPVLARYNFTPTLFAEAGLGFELNLATGHGFSDDEGTEVSGLTQSDLGDKWIYNYFDVNGFVAALEIGGGVTLDVGKFYVDLGLRIIIDVLPYVKLDDIFTSAGYEKSSAKAWQVQFVMNPWFK